MRWLKQQEQAIAQEGVIEMEAFKSEKCITFSDAYRSGQKSGKRSLDLVASSKHQNESIMHIKKFELMNSGHTTP